MGLLNRDYLFIYFLKVTVLSFWGGALSDETSGLSCVSLVFEVYSSQYLQNITYLFQMYLVLNIFTVITYINYIQASFSPGFVQQIMPYLLVS
jgi:hypothetical protein